MKLYLIVIIVHSLMTGEYIATYKSPNYYTSMDACMENREAVQDDFGESFSNQTGVGIKTAAICMDQHEFEEIFLEKAVDGIAI